MRYLAMIRHAETGQVPSERLMTDMGKLVEEMTRAGRLVTTAGLRPTAERKRLRQGSTTTTDGPFAETKEVIGGYGVLAAASMDEAVDMKRRFLQVIGDDRDIECAVRQFDVPEVGVEAVGADGTRACARTPSR